MKKPSRIYTVRCDNGSYRSGTVETLYAWLQQDFNISASGALVANRLRHRASRDPGPVPISALLFPPHLSPPEIGAYRWLKKPAKFSVEGIDHDVTGYSLWRDYVSAAGKHFPSARTITNRLHAGIRSLPELIVPCGYQLSIAQSNPLTMADSHSVLTEIRPAADNNACRRVRRRERDAKRKAAEKAAVKPTDSIAMAVKKSETNNEIIPLKPLPPMQEWSGFDKHFYRRQPL